MCQTGSDNVDNWFDEVIGYVVDVLYEQQCICVWLESLENQLP